MVLCQEIGSPVISALHLAAFAILAAAQNQMQRAARLFGAAETLRPALRHAAAVLRTAHDQAISATRAALGEKEFEAAWGEGKKMNLEEAVAYALSEAQE